MTDVLEKKELVQFCSSKSLSFQERVLTYDKESHSLLLIDKSVPSDDETQEASLSISCADIDNLCVRTYQSRGQMGSCLMVIVRGEGHFAFNFERQEALESWHHALTALMAKGPATPAATATPGGKKGRRTSTMAITPPTSPPKTAQSPELQTLPSPGRAKAVINITSVNLEQPRAGMLLALRLELGGSRHELLEVPVSATPDSCRALVETFIDRNFVSSREAASLYRYVRSLVQRKRMPIMTEEILSDIRGQDFDHVALLAPSTSSGAEIQQLAEAELLKVSASMKERLGVQGAGSEIVVSILARSIEKMKLINGIKAKLYVPPPS